MENLYGMTLAQLQQVCMDVKLPKFTAKQIADWLYKKHITDIDQMSNISVGNRQKLKDGYSLGLTAPIKETESTDGTKKYLFKTEQKQYIESAFIPDNDRATLCVSSQAGCRTMTL